MLRRLPLFAELSDEALELVRASAQEVKVPAGEPLIERWHGTRHLYVIVEGSVEIRAGSHHFTRGPGDFFGEVAALDWGAGFGYARTATVVAATPLRALVLAPEALGALLGRAPEVERTLRAAAHDRLTRI
jgi:CRP-like cAMP-binding protein